MGTGGDQDYTEPPNVKTPKDQRTDEDTRHAITEEEESTPGQEVRVTQGHTKIKQEVTPHRG